MKPIQYFVPKTMTEALSVLQEYGPKATIVAGGTDVVVNMHHGKLKPEVIVYIGNLGLEEIKEEGNHLVLGALTKIAAIAASSLLKKKAPLLPMAASSLGNPLTRNQATVGGNLVSASPAADMAICLLGLDGEVTLVSSRGQRQVALADFFTGYRQTLKKPEELLTAIRIPLKDVKGTFLKLGRRQAASLSVVNVSCALSISQGGKCEEARLTLGAMAPTPIRATKAEGLLKGEKVTEALIEKAAQAAVDQTQPIDDGRATAWYRKKAAQVLVARALKQSIS
ncbi:MAG: xanthine dehydrogenase family protein subunit M [Thermodesulfobacteriota bacterium]|nr:xanthine dehydrogenase family protein subunit M [Thermodesulfobacteriota bacterium]